MVSAKLRPAPGAGLDVFLRLGQRGNNLVGRIAVQMSGMERHGALGNELLPVEAF